MMFSSCFHSDVQRVADQSLACIFNSPLLRYIVPYKQWMSGICQKRVEGDPYHTFSVKSQRINATYLER